MLAQLALLASLARVRPLITDQANQLSWWMGEGGGGWDPVQWWTSNGRGAPRQAIGTQLVTWLCVTPSEGSVWVGLGREGLRFVGEGKMCGGWNKP